MKQRGAAGGPTGILPLVEKRPRYGLLPVTAPAAGGSRPAPSERTLQDSTADAFALGGRLAGPGPVSTLLSLASGAVRDPAEAAMQVDAAVRTAANDITGGDADKLAAGMYSLPTAVVHPSRAPQAYTSNLDKEYVRDRFDAANRPAAQLAGHGLGMYLAMRGAGKGAENWSAGLSSIEKGRLGEQLSIPKTLLRGDIPIKAQKRVPLSNGYTVADKVTLRNKVIESKFGPTADLRPRQRQAQRELGDRYLVDWWLPKDVGRIGSAGGGILALAGIKAAQSKNAPKKPGPQPEG